MKIRNRTHQIVEVARPGDRLSQIFDISILSLIGLNVVAMIVESVPSMGERWAALFWAFEVVSVVVFTVEYLLRLWCCVESARFAHPVRGRLRYMVTPMAIIDMLAIVPFYLPMLGVDLRFVRTLRLFRLARVAKMGRYSTALQTIQQVFRIRKEELIISMTLLIALVVLASSLVYFAERDAQPEQFGSIPAAMWWAVVTLTTVGYGDIYPITPVGRLLSAVIAVLGIGMVALPTGILGSGFAELMSQKDKGRSRCPHCGGVLNKPPGEGEAETRGVNSGGSVPRRDVEE